ncbi:membrane protein [Streptomyces viridochromogenes]|uniref:Membrane protein n=1 Tax=Streptomyces viridochromogenes TaxID=1938 RepID=A0A0J7ZD56_STRVR|nr:ABC transporter permease [Streptomyces viridochromogenes]KMS73332.1 membrane protein [Streptomyces viridochromogenes]KOG24403.1 membrane protein [Streptomyces viridochromogenes]KOG25508.1 membrane protein [Streptomyces viridochromogenes]
MTSSPFLAEVKDAVTPRATLLVTGVVALALLFIASYVGALHDPKPRNVPIGVVAPEVAAQQTVDRLENLPGAPLSPRTVADEETARRQILNRDIDGALLINPTGTTDTLLVATGAGRVLATTLETLLTTLEKSEARTLRTLDVVPADRHDANGLTSFYVTVGWCVGGYLCASIMTISSGAGRPTPRRSLIRLIAMAVVALVAGLGGALIVGPVLGALPGSIAALWGVGALIVFAVGAATLAFQAIFGLAGIGLVILIVVILGNPSAGGALPPPLLPPFWRDIGPALPPGAGTWATRSIAYFKGNDTTGSLLVLSAWAAAGTAITLLAARLRTGAETS